MTSGRRLSQAISEGDGISVIAIVADAESARAAEEQGAEALAIVSAVSGLREATSLPVLGLGDARGEDADAYLLRVEDAEDDLEAWQGDLTAAGFECVVDVQNEEEVELALERIEPEIFLLSPRAADGDEDELERVLDLLPDVPAGKLAIADLRDSIADGDTVAALERAGFDAVLVRVPDLRDLVGTEPPEG